jgi:DNA polymerase-3 subunit delta'
MWGIIGNGRAVAAVARALSGPTPPHAFLFIGPEHVGKAAVAAKLAQAVNCAGAEPPCGECRPCQRIAAGIHADVQTVCVELEESGPQRKAISVDQVREVERAVALNPFEGKSRVVIIDPADEMTVQAQNAFLKTLEEPPPRVVFVLIAEREDRMLETVRSRCRRIDFGLTPMAEVEAELAARNIEPQRARLLARLCGGRPGWALEMAAEAGKLEKRRETLESARELARLSVRDRMALAERLTEDFRKDRERVVALLGEWQGWWRDVMLAQRGAADGIANVDMAAAVREDAERYDAAGVSAFVQALRDARQQLGENVQPRLALDSLLLSAPGPVGIAS